MKEIRFLEPAKIELDEAVDYFNFQKPGLGQEFKDEIYEGLKRIKSFPEISPKISKNVRKHVISRFPYLILYQVEATEIPIVAIANTHRRPNYWQRRIKQ